MHVVRHAFYVVSTLAVFAMFVPPSGAAPGDVLKTFDAPCKYPAGMVAADDSLYVLDWREAKIHQIAIADGALRQTWDAPTLKPHGLTFAGGLLYVSDNSTGRVYAFDPGSGVVEYTFKAPGSRPTGLAYADDALFILETKSRKIYKVIPSDGTILAYFKTPSRSCTCLAFDGRYLWTVDRTSDEFYMLDPETGMVLGILDSPAPHPTGVAIHDGALWSVDFQTRKLYQQKLYDMEQPYRLSDTREARVEYYWALHNYGPGEVRDLKVNIALPPPLRNQESLSKIRYYSSPTDFRQDCWGQDCALYEFPTVAAGAKQAVGYSFRARVSAIRYLIDPARCGELEDIPDDIREKYTVDGERYRIDTPYIRETVEQIVGDERNPYWIARKIFNHMIGSLKYEMIGGWDVPEVVLKRGTGSCSEYTFAFIALCRAAGLPARYQAGVVVRGDDASVDEAFHRWAEIYLPNYGWIPVDANKGDAKSAADQCRGFGDLANRFLITTRGGGGSEYLGWSYNSFSTYKTIGYCNVHEENYGFWAPVAEGEEAPVQMQAMEQGECGAP